MNITIKTAAVDFVLTGANGEIIASHKAENVSTTLDMAALLSNMASLAQLFHKLDTEVKSVVHAPVNRTAVLRDAAHELCDVLDTLDLTDMPSVRTAMFEVRDATRDQEVLDATRKLSTALCNRFLDNAVVSESLEMMRDARRVITQ